MGPGIVGRALPSGTIAIRGVMATESDGTTFSSVRFSPLKMFPS